MCILGLLSLLLLPAKQLPGEVQATLGEVLKAALKLLAAYKDQVAREWGMGDGYVCIGVCRHKAGGLQACMRLEGFLGFSVSVLGVGL